MKNILTLNDFKMDTREIQAKSRLDRKVEIEARERTFADFEAMEERKFQANRRPASNDISQYFDKVA